MDRAREWNGSVVSDPRPLFSEASRTFLAVARSVEPDEWDTPGLGEWNLRELVAHTGRAFTTIEDYLGGSGHEETALCILSRA